ncbi:MAG: UDP-N-acetylmuramate--L-alanine ligase [Bdellovibrionota bacterium]|nr:UDP-N-acetylmuramate--L-alanine ligase [Bdellovibrionota bacterium]
MRKQKSDVVVHFIGIGGIGMSAIAEILIQLGFTVQGSDLNESPNVVKLRGLGAKVFIGHQPANIENATVVTHSSAVNVENPEYLAALDKGLPLLRRAQILTDIMNLKKGIAIAGTHGKTTTTSLMATLLKEIGADPTYIIGGIVHNLGGHANVGNGEYIVAEADESDGSFLSLNPVASVITNIDNDHIDHYGSEEGLVIAFHQFANKIPFFGVCALNFEDSRLRDIAEVMDKPYVSFSAHDDHQDVDYYASEIEQSPEGVTFNLAVYGENKGKFNLKVPGRHNVLNTLGALALCMELGYEAEELKLALNKYEGVGRRFQKVLSKGDFEVVDDYGHHPTEILETIKTAKEAHKDKEIIVVFEPHRYTRTKTCWSEFLHCFNSADKVLIAPIYPASEEAIVGINSENLSNDINQLHPNLTESFESWDRVKEVINSVKDTKALVLSLGAGSVGKKVKEIVTSL